MVRSSVIHRFVALLYTTALSAAPLSAQNATPRYTSGWGDVAVTLGGGVVAGLSLVARPPHAPCAPCDSLDLPAFERVGIRANSGSARMASHVLLVGIVGGAALASLSGGDRARARGNIAVLADAGSWTFAATELLKVGVHRSRPALYRADAPAAAGSADRLRHLPDHRHQGVLGQQAGRAAHRDRSRQHQIPGIGESPMTGQRRGQATLAQHRWAPGNPINRAAGIGRHADQGESCWRHPIDATATLVPRAVTARTAVRIVHSSPAAHSHQNLHDRARRPPQDREQAGSLNWADICALAVG